MLIISQLNFVDVSTFQHTFLPKHCTFVNSCIISISSLTLLHCISLHLHGANALNWLWGKTYSFWARISKIQIKNSTVFDLNHKKVRVPLKFSVRKVDDRAVKDRVPVIYAGAAFTCPALIPSEHPLTLDHRRNSCQVNN